MNKLFLSALAITSIILCYLYYSERGQSRYLQSHVEELESALLSRNFVEQKLWLNSERVKSIISTNSKLPELLVEEEDGNRKLLNEINPGKGKVFFRYSALGCNTCTEQVIAMINELGISITYVATYQRKNYLNTFKRMNRIEQPIYNAQDRMLFAIDSLQIPYLFVTDSEDQIVDVHIPISDDLSFTDEFLRKLN